MNGAINNSTHLVLYQIEIIEIVYNNTPCFHPRTLQIVYVNLKKNVLIYRKIKVLDGNIKGLRWVLKFFCLYNITSSPFYNDDFKRVAT